MKIRLAQVLSRKFLDNHRAYLTPDYFQKLWDSPLGCELTIIPIKPKHTDEQRGYYWPSLRLWGSEIGYSVKESEDWLHNAVCCETFGVLKILRVKGSLIEVPKETSKRLTIEQYSQLIETLLRLAAEDNVTLPSPPEKP